MGLFRKKVEEEVDDDIETSEDEPRQIKRQFKDLKAENQKTRKEPLKPWGKTERLTVFIVLLVTVVTSGILALSARNFKIPQIPRLKISDISNLNPFREQVILVGNKGTKISQEKINNTKKLFKDMTNNYSGIYAFYIYDINGDYYYGLNYQEEMQAASLIKLPVMYQAYKAFESGKLDRDQYTPLIEAMGKRSDNNAFIKMVSLLGKENVNKTINDLGMTKTSYSENLTTPEEIGIFFKKLQNGELLNNKDTQELKGFMTDTIFEDWLRPGIPKDIELVHKYGREVHVVNDAGIIMSQKPFIIVIMSDGVIESEADDLIPKLTNLLYNEHTKVDD